MARAGGLAHLVAERARRLLGLLTRLIHQPQVIAEVTAGILLGSLVAAAVNRNLVPADVLAFGWAYTVEQATRYPGPVNCDDVPEAWLDFVMVWFPSE